MIPEIGVRVQEHRGIPVIHVEGEIDVANATELRNQILASVSNAVPGLILDLSGVTYLDSRGVQLVLELAERMKIRHLWFRVVMPEKSVVQRILFLTHVDAVVPLDTTVEDAARQILAGHGGGVTSPNHAGPRGPRPIR